MLPFLIFHAICICLLAILAKQHTIFLVEGQEKIIDVSGMEGRCGGISQYRGDVGGYTNSNEVLA
jgi:hypothetical protein